MSQVPYGLSRSDSSDPAHGLEPAPVGSAVGQPAGSAGPQAPAVRVTNYAVSCLPLDHEDSYLYTVEVSYRGRGRWAVKHLSDCYDAEGLKAHEMQVTSRTSEWLDRYRFDLDSAIALAVRIAPTLKIMGRSVADALTDITEEPNA